MSKELFLAESLLQHRKFDLAEQKIRFELAENPDNAYAHMLLAWSLSRQEKYREALSEIETAIGLDPAFSNHYYHQANILHALGKRTAAAHSIREAIRLNPSEPQFYCSQAAIELDLQHFREAKDASEKGLELDPDHVGCANVRAMAMIHLGQKKNAGQTLSSALNKEPENAFTHANMGWTLLHKGDHTKALEHFKESLRLDPHFEWARRGIVEAMKARNIVYRLMLKYFLFMSKLGTKGAWMVLIGAFILSRFLGPFIIVYLIFALMTWLSQPIFDLLLRLDKYGRLVLMEDQIAASNWVGGLFLGGILFGLAGLILGKGLLIWTALGIAALALPVSGVFKAQSTKIKLIMGGYAFILALILIGSVWAALSGNPGYIRLVNTYIIMLAIYTWFGNALFSIDR